MSFEFVLRLIGMVILSLVGVRLGVNLAEYSSESVEVWGLIFGLVGSLFGLILTPHITTRPATRIRKWLVQIPVTRLIAGILGLLVGLVVASLASLPLSLLSPPFNAYVPIILAVAMAYFGMVVFSARQREIVEFITRAREGIIKSETTQPDVLHILLDTSVIIDGRIAEIASTGFIMGTLVVPQFVLNELQYIADSSETLRRQRGRRGFEILDQLQNESQVPVEITEMDVEGIDEVDHKLLRLAEELGYKILTNDYNLNRIAHLQGIEILNINDLAHAVRTIMLPGEELTIEVIQRGREINQGVGYLEDGTMVVIEEADQFIGKRLRTTVTRVIQTTAGRMIFARPADDSD